MSPTDLWKVSDDGVWSLGPYECRPVPNGFRVFRDGEFQASFATGIEAGRYCQARITMTVKEILAKQEQAK